jgi:hypothetical protein
MQNVFFSPLEVQSMTPEDFFFFIHNLFLIFVLLDNLSFEESTGIKKKPLNR